jgi:hypothetical protein
MDRRHCGDGGVIMMRHTPRTFIGPVVFLLDNPMSPETADLVRTHLRRMPGVSCEPDTALGAIVVTADVPTDRSDIVDVLDHLGCRVQDL